MPRDTLSGHEGLGLAIPILQAPIGNAGTAILAAEVSRAGGLGALALTWTSPPAARSLVSEVRALTDRPFQVNFVLSFEARSLPAALEAGAPVVTFSWGLPVQQAPLVRSFGAKLGVQVSTREGARQALDIGVDFLICQGVEAGGHVQATQSLWKTLPIVCEEAGATPVFAAGGLTVGADIARAVLLGATGGMLGTRFVACVESAAHPTYKDLLLTAQSENSTLTMCFDGGWPDAPHRVLRNKTLEDWEAAGCPSNGARPGNDDVIAVYPEAGPVKRYQDTPPLQGMTGAVTEMCLYAGTGVGAIRDVPKAGDLVARLWAECAATLNAS
jgi:nitronate monooxygenase